MDPNTRLQRLLQAIVQEYIKTAHPVGSKTLVNEYGFDYSPATIRNDMAVLEQAGYITQPHTSAGRIPSEKGYQYYIQHFIHDTQLSKRQKEAIEHAFDEDVTAASQQLKSLARVIAEITDEVVVLSTPNHEYYFTGISHLLRKPEFAEVDTMVSLSETFDHLDEVMSTLQQRMQNTMEVLIGNDNPFSTDCAVIISQYQFGHQQQKGIVAILGPMRMNYDKNIAILEYMESLMQQEYDQR